MKLRYLALLVVAMVSLTFGGSIQPALAQSDNETVQFKNVVLWINPEYDDLRLLVMLEGNLDGVTAPVRVRFLVPEAAEMYSAGSKDAQGKYTGGPPDRQASEILGWDEISYELQTDTFRVEYYDPIIFGQPDKTISYDFRTISPISNLRVVVQQPRKASNFTVTPQGSIGTDFEGFTVYSYFLNDPSADAPLHFDIAYTRSETNPSLEPGGPGGSSTGSSTPSLVMLVILGVALIVGLILWMLKSRQSRYVPVRASGKQRKRAARQPSPGNRFCPKCGQPAGASDKFCPSCGNKLRDAT